MFTGPAAEEGQAGPRPRGSPEAGSSAGPTIKRPPGLRVGPHVCTPRRWRAGVETLRLVLGSPAQSLRTQSQWRDLCEQCDPLGL